jgi:hypothetical protein
VHPYSEGYNKAALANLRGFEPNFNPLDEPDPVADTQVEAEQEADSTAAPQKIKGAYNEAWKKVGQTEYKKKRDQLDPQEPTNKQRGKNLQPVLAVTAMAKEDKKLRKTRK